MYDIINSKLAVKSDGFALQRYVDMIRIIDK
jgi:hypothetical protein